MSTSFRRSAARALALLAVALAAVLARPGVAAAPERPRNLILLISDGCGEASFTLARRVGGHPLALDPLRTGRVVTTSADGKVTDSAAGATAYATGVRTSNRRLGRDPEGRPLVSWFSAAADRGLATGLVVTTEISDATPAAFVARVHDRSAHDSVVVQLFARRVDVVLGGGRQRFRPASAGGRRKDVRDLMAEARARGDQVVTDADALAKAGRRGRLLGLFAPGPLDYWLDRDDRQPGLALMARTAIARLSRDPDGFVLVVEGSRIDHSGHENDPATHAREVLEYDAMAREVLAWARRDRRTLVVATSDHETGGLEVGKQVDVELLRRVRSSIPRMAAAIAVNGDAAGVLAREAGITGLDGHDRAALAAAGNAQERLDEALAKILSRRAGVTWNATGHTGADVPLFATGPGAESLRGTLENREVGRRIAAAMGLPSGLAP